MAWLGNKLVLILDKIIAFGHTLVANMDLNFIGNISKVGRDSVAGSSRDGFCKGLAVLACAMSAR